MVADVRCRANILHIKQSRPVSSLGFQVTIHQVFEDVFVRSKGKNIFEHSGRGFQVKILSIFEEFFLCF